MVFEVAIISRMVSIARNYAAELYLKLRGIIAFQIMSVLACPTLTAVVQKEGLQSNVSSRLDPMGLSNVNRRSGSTSRKTLRVDEAKITLHR